jgi:hypothetical protein
VVSSVFLMFFFSGLYITFVIFVLVIAEVIGSGFQVVDQDEENVGGDINVIEVIS